ncbi:MAG: CheR family methyltransferase [Acidobacteriota bacterium]
MSALSFSSDTPLDDPGYSRLKEYLVKFTGLAYYSERDTELARLLGRRLAATGLPDCTAYFNLLQHPLHGVTELDALIAEITIGETYFFRHQEHFDALRDQVFPELIQRNGRTRSLRIWCAGCSDGCEPYSLAILLKREMADQLAGWDVTILGTDINRNCLARAREGLFPSWALRATTETLKEQCFTKEGNFWSLCPQYRKGVSFQYHNLVENLSSPNASLSEFDLIICRNVMIYFGQELMRRMVLQFHHSLVPGGWLLVGPAEPNMTFFTSFRSVQLPGLTLYQKSSESVLHSSPTVSPSFALPLLVPPSPALPPLTMPPPIVPNKSQTSAESEVETTLALAQRHADTGRWEEAARCCEGLLVTDPLNPRVHLIRGLIFEQMGRFDQAEQSLRRVIYLDHQSVLARYSLGLVLQSRGQVHPAVRCFENTLQLLDSVSRDYRYSDADGITAGELRELATMHLGILREQICNAPA